MPWAAENPLGAAFGVAASALQGYDQGQDAARERARHQKIDQQNAMAQAAALAHQQHEEKTEDTRLGFEKNADTRATAQASDTHAKDVLDAQVTRAQLAFDKQMLPLQAKAAVLQIALQRGELNAQRYAIERAKLDRDLDQIQVGIAKKYAVPEEQLKISQGYAGLDQTRASTAATKAGTDATRQNTLFGAQDHPLDQALGRADLFGRNLSNAKGYQNLTKPTDSGVDFNDPMVKQLSKDSDAALKAWETRRAAVTKGETPAVELPDGSYAMPDDLVDSSDPTKGLQKGKKPVLPAPPEDFSTFAAALGTEVDNVRAGRKSAQRSLEQVQADASMTPAQKAYALKQIRRATQAKSPIGGGPGGTTPFGSSRNAQVVRDAATEFGVPPEILDAAWAQESSRGTMLTPDGRSPDPTNKGVGWFQLDPASGAPPEVIARAARDSQFAARVAANQLAGLFRQYGSWPAALAAYNAGSPDSPKGAAYAAQVLGRLAP